MARSVVARRIACLLAGLAVLGARAEAEPLGPALRDGDGRFTNAAGDFSHGTFGVRFPFFLRRFAGSFRTRPGAPESTPNDGAFLRNSYIGAEQKLGADRNAGGSNTRPTTRPREPWKSDHTTIVVPSAVEAASGID